MSLTPTQQTVREYFDQGHSNCKVTDSNLAIETGSYARYEAHYDMPKMYLPIYFKEFQLDALFIVGYRSPKVTPLPGESPPIGYVHHLYVQAIVIDQYKSDGSLRVSAEKLADKCAQEIRHVIRDNMTGSFRLSRVEDRQVERIGSLEILFGDRISVDYTQYVTHY